MTNYRPLAILFLCIFLFGCAAEGNKPLPELRSGTQGLEMEFLKNAPPPLVFEGSNFPVILRVKNLGAFSIEKEPAILSLGVEKDYTRRVSVEIGGRISSEASGDIRNEAQFTLPGKTLSNAKGEEEIISFTITPSKIDPQSESHPTSLIATLCYPYQTELTTSVCIDPDPNNVRPVKKSCTVQDTSLAQGQGGPVAITLVQPQIIPGETSIKPQFLISIENKGKGEVVKPEYYKSVCKGSSGVDSTELNRIRMRAWLSSQELACCLRSESEFSSGSTSCSLGSDTFSFARLQSNSQVIRCFYPDGAQQIPKTTDSYTTQLRVLLEYGYVESTSTQYAIRKVAS